MNARHRLAAVAVVAGVIALAGCGASSQPEGESSTTTSGHAEAVAPAGQRTTTKHASANHAAGKSERKGSASKRFRRADSSSGNRASQGVSPTGAKRLAQEQKQALDSEAHAPSQEEEKQAERFAESSPEEEAPPLSQAEQEQREAAGR